MLVPYSCSFHARFVYPDTMLFSRDVPPPPRRSLSLALLSLHLQQYVGLLSKLRMLAVGCWLLAGGGRGRANSMYSSHLNRDPAYSCPTGHVIWVIGLEGGAAGCGCFCILDVFHCWQLVAQLLAVLLSIHPAAFAFPAL